MQTNIVSSIQDYCKKINRRITVIQIVSLSVTLLVLIGLLLFLKVERKRTIAEVVYTESETGQNEETNALPSQNPRPFGSKNGKTYTFSWCQGSTRISPKNKIYFSSAVVAQQQGRTLSKLCKK